MLRPVANVEAVSGGPDPVLSDAAKWFRARNRAGAIFASTELKHDSSILIQIERSDASGLHGERARIHAFAASFYMFCTIIRQTAERHESP
ncbi:hypothetical protein [Bradyrhizobium sp. USDA 4454]